MTSSSTKETEWCPVVSNGFGTLSKAVGICVGEISVTVEETDTHIYLHPKFRANKYITDITKDFCFSLVIANSRAEMTVVQVLNKDNFSKDLLSDKLDIVKFDKSTSGTTDGIEVKVITMLPPFAGGLTSEKTWRIADTSST